MRLTLLCMQAKEAEVAKQRAELSASEPDSAVFKLLEEVRRCSSQDSATHAVLPVR
jgi:hypothetical protein